MSYQGQERVDIPRIPATRAFAGILGVFIGWVVDVHVSGQRAARGTLGIWESDPKTYIVHEHIHGQVSRSVVFQVADVIDVWAAPNLEFGDDSARLSINLGGQGQGDLR